MSKAQIAKLEALLERVRTRAAEPRTVASAPAPAAVAAPQHPQPAQLQSETQTQPLPVLQMPAPLQAEAAEDLETTQARHVPSQRSGPARTETDIVLEVDVEAATQDTVLAVPVEETVIPEATESRERLVAAEPLASEAAESGEPAPEHVTGAPPPPQPEPAPEIVASVVEVEEETPVSSRRPVAPQPEERLAEMAFGTEEPQPARHTPPPESGRLPAAPPAPDIEFEGDVTGVREASKPAAPVEIVPEATVADIAPSDAVADMVGHPRSAAPATFLAVLDASIAL